MYGEDGFTFLRAEIFSCVIFSTTAWFTVIDVVSSFSIERLVLMNTVRLEVRRDVGDCAVLTTAPPTQQVGLKVEKYGITIV